jgi:hypothetical protein
MASEPYSKEVISSEQCTAGLSVDECEKEFKNNHRNEFEYIEVEGDGNCLFRALSEFYKRKDIGVPEFQNPKSWKPFRAFLINKLEELVKDNRNIEAQFELMIATNFANQTEAQETQILSRMAVYSQSLEDYPRKQKNYMNQLASYHLLSKEGLHIQKPDEPLFPQPPEHLPPITEKTIAQLFADLRGNNAWNVAMLELLISKLPIILGVNISIYRVTSHDNGSVTIDNYFYTPIQGYEADVTIYLLLNGAHYGLLYPRNPVMYPARPAASVAARPAMRNNNLNAGLAASLLTLRINNKIHNQKEKEHPKAILADMPASMPAMPASMPAMPRNNSNNYNFNKALAASMNMLYINNNKQYIHNNEKYANIKNNTRTRLEEIKDLYPIRTTTKAQLQKELDRYHILYDLQNDKKTLYNKFIIALRNDINNMKSKNKGGASRKARRNIRRTVRNKK